MADLRTSRHRSPSPLNALFGRTTPRRLQLTAVVNQSLRSNFQVGHDIAIGRIVAATEDDVTPAITALPLRPRKSYSALTHILSRTICVRGLTYFRTTDKDDLGKSLLCVDARR